jgi:acyl-coenzyme A synthetase/AMP-(fatty) acid ligase
MNLAELALRPGRDLARADRSAFLTAQGPVSYAQFQRLVFAIVKDLSRAGARPGDKILLRMTNSVEFAAAFLAVVWVGAIRCCRTHSSAAASSSTSSRCATRPCFCCRSSPRMILPPAGCRRARRDWS